MSRPQTTQQISHKNGHAGGVLQHGPPQSSTLLGLKMPCSPLPAQYPSDIIQLFSAVPCFGDPVHTLSSFGGDNPLSPPKGFKKNIPHQAFMIIGLHPPTQSSREGGVHPRGLAADPHQHVEVRLLSQDGLHDGQANALVGARDQHAGGGHAEVLRRSRGEAHTQKCTSCWKTRKKHSYTGHHPRICVFQRFLCVSTRTASSARMEKPQRHTPGCRYGAVRTGLRVCLGDTRLKESNCLLSRGVPNGAVRRWVYLPRGTLAGDDRQKLCWRPPGALPETPFDEDPLDGGCQVAERANADSRKHNKKDCTHWKPVGGPCTESLLALFSGHPFCC